MSKIVSYLLPLSANATQTIAFVASLPYPLLDKSPLSFADIRTIAINAWKIGHSYQRLDENKYDPIIEVQISRKITTTKRKVYMIVGLAVVEIVAEKLWEIPVSGFRNALAWHYGRLAELWDMLSEEFSSEEEASCQRFEQQSFQRSNAWRGN